MIGSITGKVASAGIDWVLVATPSGVGYRVSTTTDMVGKFPVGTDIHLSTYLVVREDQLALYGFETEGEINFFQQLLGISGVGPRVALAILNSARVDDLKTAIASNDVAIFTTISGIGLKTAQRIMIELKNKIDAIDIGTSSHTEDLLAALTQLGYNAYEVRKIVTQIPRDLTSTEDQIKYALQLLSK